MEGRVSETQVKLAELKRAQEELERRTLANPRPAPPPEARVPDRARGNAATSHARHQSAPRRAGFTARRDAEQMGKAVGDLKDFLLNEKSRPRPRSIGRRKTSTSSFYSEAVTPVEHARMEWNSALLKFPVLSGQGMASAASKPAGTVSAAEPADGIEFLAALQDRPRPQPPGGPDRAGHLNSSCSSAVDHPHGAVFSPR